MAAYSVLRIDLSHSQTPAISNTGVALLQLTETPGPLLSLSGSRRKSNLQASIFTTPAPNTDRDTTQPQAQLAECLAVASEWAPTPYLKVRPVSLWQLLCSTGDSFSKVIMALTSDLLATPLLTSHSPSEAFLGLPIPPISLDEDDLTSLVEDLPETPSPCVRRESRRVNKNRRKTPNYRFIKELERRNRSPEFAAILRNLGGPPPDGESARPGSDALESRSHDDTESQRLEQQTSALELSSPEDSQTDDSTEIPSFTPNRHTLPEIFRDMRDAYILFDRLDESPFFKIGKSTDTKKRTVTHLQKCQLRTWASRARPATPIRMPTRLERLVQAELQNLNYVPDCHCTVNHSEYFWGRKDVGLESLDFWCRWLQHNEPYDCDGRLKGFWTDRLELFQGNVDKYFRCDSLVCAVRNEDTPACRDCLRAGWKKWTEPTPEDELDYACRANIPWRQGQHLIKRFSRFGFVNTFTLVSFANVIGLLLSICKWLSEPNVYLSLIPLRLMAFWLEPKTQLPESVVRFVLSFADTVLLVVCVYARFQHRDGSVDGRGSPRRPPKRAKRSSVGEARQGDVRELEL
ncbi:uncharacterized protein APUU_21566S [Aspergillus puulaauensis]|uniref:Bacteriophage T5 Orf172 DNA-binding domain-containing protein n=1 Tax=Aspergillus puulaauensis TaxID=1220207 RepID=A0A7R7XIB1_9EURO|nr:uncharacterized protein APUU_21566S [Aspergillus puulaauensis]BCS21134.1 hypothetical protein APUU_21566S [Aspergillus puulaauensis]